MILPKKHLRNQPGFRKHSELTRSDIVAILKIARAGRIEMNTESWTGHKTIRRVPTIEEVEAKTGVTKRQIRKLIRDGWIEQFGGFLSTIKAFIHVWFYFGADPFATNKN